MNKKTLRIAGWALGLSMAVAGIGTVVGTSLMTEDSAVSVKAAEDDTHDFSQTLQQLLNNNATISDVEIEAQSYVVKEVIVTCKYNKSLNPAVAISAKLGGTDMLVGDTSEKVQQIGNNFNGTITFRASAPKNGAVNISFSNLTGNGTGHGTFSVTNVRLVEGAAEETVQATSISISPSSLTVESGSNASFTPTLNGGKGDYEKTINWVSNKTSIIPNPGEKVAGQPIQITPATVVETTEVTLTGTVKSPGTAPAASIVITVTPARAIHHYSISGKPWAYTVDSDWTLDDLELHAWYDEEETEEKSISKDEDYLISTDTEVPDNANRNVSVAIEYICGDDSDILPVSGEVFVQKTDTLTPLKTSTAASYTAWSNKTFTSTAVYAGVSGYGNDGIQLNTSTESSKRGIITTGSGGYAKSITVTWTSGNTAGRTLSVFGKSSAYSSTSELTNNELKGEELGTLAVVTTGTRQATLAIDGEYPFIGLYANAAMYISSISINWGERQSIEINHIVASEPTGTWYVGDSPSLSDLGVEARAYYEAGNEGEYEIVTSDCTIVEGLPLVLGQNTLVIQYKENESLQTEINVSANAIVPMTKVTNITSLINADTIYIASADVENQKVMAAGAFTSVEGSPTTMKSGYESIIVGADSHGYYLQRSSDLTYIANTSQTTSSGAITVKETLDTTDLTTYWDISFNNSGEAQIVSKFFSGRSIRINSTGSPFSTYYNQGQKAVAIYAMNGTPTPSEKVNTFAALYMHTEIEENEETAKSSTTTCYNYFDTARSALDGDWAAIAGDFVGSTYWNRYKAWGEAKGIKVSYSDGLIYEAESIAYAPLQNNENLTGILAIVAGSGFMATASIAFLRRKKDER